MRKTLAKMDKRLERLVQRGAESLAFLEGANAQVREHAPAFRLMPGCRDPSSLEQLEWRCLHGTDKMAAHLNEGS